MFISVDLPAPFSPRSACTSPLRRSKLTWSFARTPGNCFVMFRNSRMGASAISRDPNCHVLSGRTEPGCELLRDPPCADDGVARHSAVQVADTDGAAGGAEDDVLLTVVEAAERLAHRLVDGDLRPDEVRQREPE